MGNNVNLISPYIVLNQQSLSLSSNNFNIHRIAITATPPKTENVGLKSEQPLKKVELKSKPLKTSNGITNMTNGHTLRSRAARAAARAAESHKLTEYFKEELKSPKVEPPPSPPPRDKTVKVESKVTNGNMNHKLTEYFPVRRSVRKTSKCVLAEKMRDLERAVREQKEDGLQVNDKLAIFILCCLFLKVHTLLQYNLI